MVPAAAVGGERVSAVTVGEERASATTVGREGRPRAAPYGERVSERESVCVTREREREGVARSVREREGPRTTEEE
jgi:hypothetical protein